MRPRILTIGIVICILLTAVCKAQTCTGTYGPAIFTKDFGAGTPVIGAALPASYTSSYSYSGSTPPSDGQYTIANNTGGMYANWWTMPDHTGNQGGYMMIVNSKFDPADPATNTTFYTQPATLCANTTYQFSVYIKNLIVNAATYRPNITISINTATGVLLKSFVTNDIPEDASAAWGAPYTFLFTTPANENSIIIKMENTNHGGTGNDFAIDDISIRPCGPLMIAGFGAAGYTTYNNCTANPKQDTLAAQITPAPYVNPQYQWQVNTGNAWSNIGGATTAAPYIFNQPVAVGTYQYRLASADGTNINSSSCLIYSNIITLTVSQSPIATATTATPTVCEGSTLTLNGGGGSTYSWTDPNGTQFSTSQNPIINNITLAQGGNYTVTASLNGCTSQASVNITVQPKVIATVSPDVTICSGATAQLQASGGTSYKWTPATGLSNDAIANPIASPTDTTKYTVTVTDNTCSSTATVNVNVIKPPVFSAGGNKSVILGQSVRLTGSIKGNGLTYFWTPTTFLDDPTSLTPLATPIADITYTLHVTSSCTTVTDTSQVKVYKKIVIPNVFSPNGDGVNDTWEITGLDAYAESVVSVFTRNGQLVYSVVGYSKAWDGTYNGKILPEGAYYYIIDLKNATPVLSGYITLIR